MVKKILFLVASLLLSNQLLAKTMYVSDKAVTPFLRSGQTNAYRILENLTGGAAVEVLEINNQSGYTKVITNTGTEGWILTRHLVSTPVAKAQQAGLQEKNSEPDSSKTDTPKNMDELIEQNQLLETSNSKLQEELEYVKQVSGNAININQRNQQLIEENQQLKNSIDLLNSDNERLKSDANSQFFMMGAGAILLGLFLGLVLPSLKSKRKDSGWI